MSFHVHDGNSLLEVLGGNRKTLWHLFAIADALLMCSRDAAAYYQQLLKINDERIFIFAGCSLHRLKDANVTLRAFIEHLTPIEAYRARTQHYNEAFKNQPTLDHTLRLVLGESDAVLRRQLLTVIGYNVAQRAVLA